MKISIITASYNSANTLQKCINSVIQQTYSNIEYIIVDGNSTDQTLAIIKQNQKHITKYISENDTGIYDALNKGLQMATGDIIGFLNSDDEYADNKTLEKIIDAFQTKKCSAIYGDLIYQSKEEKPHIIRYWKSNNFKEKSLRYGWMPPHPTLYCSRQIYQEIGVFDTTFKISSDYDFILRLFQEKSFSKVYIHDVLIKMTVGGISNGNFKNIIWKLKEDHMVLHKNQMGSLFTLFLKNFRKTMQFNRLRSPC